MHAQETGDPGPPYGRCPWRRILANHIHLHFGIPRAGETALNYGAQLFVLHALCLNARIQSASVPC